LDKLSAFHRKALVAQSEDEFEAFLMQEIGKIH
jgi:hypothetical protein